MTKHDRNWTFAIVVLAIVFLVGPCFWARAEEQAAPTCQQNAVHIATTNKELQGVIKRFNASTDDNERLILGAEGQFMNKMLNMLTKWREVNHCDV